MIRHTFYYYVFVNLFSNICINPILIGIYINLYIILIIKWWNFFFSILYSQSKNFGSVSNFYYYY